VTHSVKRHRIVSDVTKQGYPLDCWNVTRDVKFAGTLEHKTTAIGRHSCSSLFVLKCLCLATNQNDFAWLQDRVLAYGPVQLLVYSICVS